MADPIHQFAIQKVGDLGDVTLPVLGTVDLAITNSHIAMTVAFGLIGIAQNDAGALSILVGLAGLAVSLPGGVLWLQGGDRRLGLDPENPG